MIIDKQIIDTYENITLSRFTLNDGHVWFSVKTLVEEERGQSTWNEKEFDDFEESAKYYVKQWKSKKYKEA